MKSGRDEHHASGPDNEPERVFREFSPLPYHSLNAAGELLTVNDAWLDCLGYDREAVEGRAFKSLLPESSVDRFERAFERLKTEGSAATELQIRHEAGHLLRIDLRGRAEFAETGEFERCHGQFLDTRTVHEQSVQLEKAQDVANIGRWSKSIPSDTIRWSDRVYEIWGLERDPGPIDHERFIESVHPEDRERVEAAWRAAKAGDGYDVEHRIVTNEGEVRWVREKAEIEFDDAGSPVSATGIVQDITEQRNREQEYRERGEKYETLVEASQDGIIVVQESEFAMVNERFAEMLGYSDPAEIEGEPFIESVAPEDRDLVKERYQARVRGEPVPSRYEIEALTRTGESLPVELSASRVTYDGFPADMAVVRDVSERKAREKDLRRFKNAVDAAGQAILISDADGRIEYVNPAFESITGYTKAATIGRNPRFLKSGEMSPEFYEEMWETITAGDTWEAEFTNRRKDGELYHVHQTVAPIVDEEGTIEAYAAVQTDITDRVEQERRLQIQTERLDLAMDGANLAVWDWDMETDEVYRDERWAEMLGYRPEAVGNELSDWRDLIFPRDAKAHDRALERHIEGEAEYMDVEYRMQTSEGDWKWVRNLGKVVERDADGTPTRAVGIHQDIDERTRTKQALRKNNELLQAIDRVLRHNINNDMNVIKGFAETLRDGLAEPRRTQAERIVRSSEKLLETTDKERRITKLLSEDQVPETTDIGAISRRVAARHREQYPAATVTVSGPESAQVTALSHIDEAIEELMENATIHTPDSEPVIDVQITVDGSEGVIVQIADEGPGIPEMEHQVLTGEGEITPLYHGSGLGLWFVNLVVTRSEGELDFHERAGGGSVVTIRLPAA